MEKLLIVGAGGFGRVVYEHARNIFECAFIDDNIQRGTTICGCSVIGTCSDLIDLYKQYKNLIVAVGDNRFREKTYSIAQSIGFNFPNLICDSAYVSPFAIVGNGCVILNNVVIQNGSRVGNGVILNPGVEVHHDSVVCDYALIYTNSVIRTYSEIGKRAWIGSNLTVGNNVHIEDDGIVENGMTINC